MLFHITKRSQQRLSVHLEAEVHAELVGGFFAQEHSPEEYLEVVHHRAVFGVDIKHKRDIIAVNIEV